MKIVRRPAKRTSRRSLRLRSPTWLWRECLTPPDVQAHVVLGSVLAGTVATGRHLLPRVAVAACVMARLTELGGKRIPFRR